MSNKVSLFDSTMASSHPLSILIVEDNAVNQKVVSKTLLKFGYESDIANNGVEAIEAALQKSYDLILMDIQMPVMDGIEATKEILAHAVIQPKPRIVALSANLLGDKKQLSFDAGMYDFLEKPLTVSALLGQLEDLVGLE